MIGESSYTRVPVLQRQLRDFGVVALLAVVIATSAFVVVRNKDLAARQIELAQRTARELADGRPPLPTVQAALVSAATPSRKHPYLRQRKIQEPEAAWRPLVASTDPMRASDKLFYDAATRFDRDGVFADLMPDASGRAAKSFSLPLRMSSATCRSWSSPRSTDARGTSSSRPFL